MKKTPDDYAEELQAILDHIGDDGYEISQCCNRHFCIEDPRLIHNPADVNL